MQTLDQQRARAAWEATEAATVNKEYVSLCSGAPVLILTNGLGPALAFLLAKAEGEEGHHLRLANALGAWVLRRAPDADKNGRGLMRAITLANIPTYRRYTTEALAYLNWLKRFAVATGEGDDGTTAEAAQKERTEADSLPPPPCLARPLPDPLLLLSFVPMPLPLPQPLQNLPSELALHQAHHFRYAYYLNTPLRVSEAGEVVNADGDDAVEAKAVFFEQAVRTWNDSRETVDGLLQRLTERREAQARSLRGAGCEVCSLELKTATRLLVGMGYSNGAEVGLGLHHTYGVPYLPGSSVKGLARAWATDYGGVDPETLKRLFGSPSKDEGNESTHQQGIVHFHDVFPTAFPKLERDVLTPHFSPYYGNPADVPPAVWHDPNPVTFLVVAKGQPFGFLFTARTAGLYAAQPGDADLVKGWLENALAWLGIGGKTGAGYGRFETPAYDAIFTSSSSTRPRTDSISAGGAGKGTAGAGGTTSSKPSASTTPPKHGRLTKNSSKVPAQVVGHAGGMLRVRLLAEGAEHLPEYDLGGVNASDFKEGSWVLVNVANWSNRRRRPAQISYVSRWKGGS